MTKKEWAEIDRLGKCALIFGAICTLAIIAILISMHASVTHAWCGC